MALLRTTDGRTRFEWRGSKLYQRSAVYPDLEWEVTLVPDTLDPANPKYNPRAARAKLMSKLNSAGTSMKWGPGVPAGQLAHANDEMACYTCHLSWTTSCGGCHLPIEANQKTAKQHYEGGTTRNYATYNPQVAREDTPIPALSISTAGRCATGRSMAATSIACCSGCTISWRPEGCRSRNAAN